MGPERAMRMGGFEGDGVVIVEGSDGGREGDEEGEGTTFGVRRASGV